MPQFVLQPDLDLGAIAPRPMCAEGNLSYSASRAGWVEVLVDCPGAQGVYTYRIPEEITIQPGDILSVPFGGQQVGGVAIQVTAALTEALDAAVVRDVEDVVCRGFFSPTYWALLHQVADYYCTPLMQVVRVALPPGLLGRSQRRIRLRPDAIPPGAEEFLQTAARQILERLRGQKQGDYTWNYLQRNVRGAKRGLQDLLQRGWVESYLEPPSRVRPKQQLAVTLVDSAAALSPRQQEVVDVLRRHGGDLWLQDLLQLCCTSSSVVRAIAAKGAVILHHREVLRADLAPVPPDIPKSLTVAQAEAVQAIAALEGPHQVLLHGVTGSGKTEVYLQAIAPILQQGKSALVLVPEIGLTPQLTDRFLARFGGRVRVYHSALSDGERYDTWRQMLQATPQVVIGTRSAIFAPLPQLGLIVLDEEHDSSFKQDQPAPCYHARTVAQWRAAQAQCPLILGTATPALDTWITHHPAANLPPLPPQPLRPLNLTLPDRIHARPLPPIRVIDMRQELQAGNRSIFSRSLQQALGQLRQKRQQGILFMHRRGHSTFVSCRSCGYVMECPHCDVSLTYHHTQAETVPYLRCHYCGYGRSHPDQCPDCGSPYLKHFGSGTQRVAQELLRQFPDLRILRYDSDTTRTKGSHRALLSRFAQGEADVLVGTQMLTKGIDVPQVTLVGIVAADGLLHLADYRAGERAFQIMTQVAGRAGRGAEPGQVLVQTYSPQHPVIEAVQSQKDAGFLATELAQRQALRYPPFSQIVLLRLSSPDAAEVRQTAEALAASLQTRIQADQLDCELLGPAPAAILRVARRYRWHLLLKCPAGSAQSLAARLELAQLRSRCPAVVSLTLDVDPLNLL
ncbi:MAG: primosomal protein N' [Synechococcales bacterium]|nr:primosomal protein N' [Synechococcales bacterium]